MLEGVVDVIKGGRLNSKTYTKSLTHVLSSLDACRLSLSQFNPLLEGVVNVKEGGQLLSTYEPEAGLLPALRGQVWQALN
jgi:hypothetical protein